MKKIISKLSRKKVVLETIQSYGIEFEYNSAYITKKSGKFFNKTGEKRYLISKKISIEKNMYVQEKLVPQNIQLIVFNEKNLKTKLNTREELILNGQYYFMIQMEPNTQFSISDMENIFTVEKGGQRGIVRTVELSTNDLVLQQQRELFLLSTESIKEQIEEMKNKLMHGKKNIIYIGDGFTYGNLKNQFNVINLSFHEIEIFDYIVERYYRETTIDFVLIESLWEGKDNSFFFYSPEKKRDALRRIIEICRKRWIKTVLYNKEDPIHFNSFISIARLTDFVITTDENMISEYKNHGVKNVTSFVFFINQKTFNPFNIENLEEKIFFAGSYYPKYAERCNFVNSTFEKFNQDFNLEIIDRNLNMKHTPNKYPAKISKYITNGGLPIPELIEFTKNHKYTINLNSVINSDSMIARRVFEQIALGKIVVSNYAKSIEKVGLEGLVFDESNNYVELKKQMLEIENSKTDILRRSLQVLRKYSAKVFEREIYNFINGMKAEYKIYVYSEITTLDNYVRLLKSLSNQTYQEYILLIRINNEDLRKKINYMNSKGEVEIIQNMDDILYNEIPILEYNLNNIYEENMILDHVICLDIMSDTHSILSFIKKDNDSMLLEYENPGISIYKDILSYTEREKSPKISINFLQKTYENVDTYLGAEMIINNLYPSDTNLYAHAFVHARIKNYEKKSYFPFVVILKNQKINVTHYCYDGICIFEVNKIGFEFLKSNFKITKFAIHFINSYIVDTLNEYAKDNLKVVWLHGSDSLLAKRKKHLYDLNNKSDKDDYLRRERIMNHQYKIFDKIFYDSTYTFVFVSNWLKEVVEADFGNSVSQALVLSNPIDTDYFEFKDKSVTSEEKVKIFSIRPFPKYRLQYANDILANVILELSKREVFSKIEIEIVGNGEGFEESVKIIKDEDFSNVILTKKFLTKDEIKKRHQNNHIILMPSRQDTHGVSFFEGISSGLLGISSNNSAKPEYLIDGKTGFLCDTENIMELADVIEHAVREYNNLAFMREAGRKFVEEKSEINMVIAKEIALIKTGGVLK